jgi:hypothetical protein
MAEYSTQQLQNKRTRMGWGGGGGGGYITVMVLNHFVVK